MTARFRSSLPIVVASLLSLHCGASGDDPGRAAPVPVELDFAFEIAGESFSCGSTYAGIGDPAADFSLTDARFYAYAFELLGSDGRAHPLALDETAFQGDGIALLDFEDGCGPDGTAETHTTVTGSVTPGDYRGVRFTLGVPPQQNFIDLAAAPPPLDVTGMFWTWQYGYKFLKLDGAVPAEGGGINPFFIHLGSSGCPGDNAQAPPPGLCASPNRVSYTLDGFTLDGGRIVAEIAGVLATSDLSFNTEGTAPGCMSEANDPECQAILPRMGIDDADTQLFFATH